MLYLNDDNRGRISLVRPPFLEEDSKDMRFYPW